MILRPVVGYEGRYSVTNDGRIYSHISKRKNKWNSLHLGETGYLKVGLLSEDGSFKFAYVHRLVAEAFIPRETFDLEVNHIDGIKTNNAVNNLEWVSHQRNIDHLYEAGLRNRATKKERTSFVRTDRKQKFIPSINFDEVKKKYRELGSVRKVAKEMAVSHETVRQSLIYSGLE